VFFPEGLHIQPKGSHGYIPAERKFPTMVEDTSTTIGDDISKISWELFEEYFCECYMSEEFIERKLNEFNSL
jgi:hypothetical protein